MRKSLSHGTGYLTIDHRESPGISAADVAAIPGAIAAPGGTVTETDVYQCSHCQRTVVLQAVKDRLHLRGYCSKCDHYICNSCEKTRVASGGECVPFKAILDKAQEVAEKFIGRPDHPDAVTDPESLRKEIASTHTVTGSPRIELTDK